MWDKVVEQFAWNPLNWALAVLVAYLAKTLFTRQSEPVEAKHPKVTVLRGFTLEELRKYDGEGSDVPIYMAIDKKVFDVTKGRSFYGKGGSYGTFAGRDASRGMAKYSFDTSMLSDKPDKLDDLTESEWDSMRQWSQFFENKYPVVGWMEDEAE